MALNTHTRTKHTLYFNSYKTTRKLARERKRDKRERKRAREKKRGREEMNKRGGEQ